MSKIIPISEVPFHKINLARLKTLPIWLASDPHKKPINVHTGKVAKWSDPQELATFDQVQTFIKDRKDFFPAFVLTKELNIVFIDLDHCYKDGQLTTFAQTILNQTGKSFAEKSRSGTGLHILIQGKMAASGTKHSDIEIYSDKKVVTLTFDHIDNRQDIEPHQNIVDSLLQNYARQQEEPPEEDSPPTMDTLEVIAKIKTSSHHKILFEEGFNKEIEEHYKKTTQALTLL